MTLKGGIKTKGGFYWRKGEWEIVTVEGKTGALPGAENAEYLRIPSILFVPVAMFISVLYVVFLPLIGFVMLLRLIVTKAARGLRAVPRPRMKHAKPAAPAENTLR